MSTRKALAFSFLDRYAGLVLAIVSSMILSRLLSPAEIGVFSVTMVLLSFVATIRDLGAGQYLVQVKELTTERIRAVWAVQLGLGTTLSIVILAASGFVASFYHEPRMKDIMLVLAANYVITPFGSLTYAWLMREMRFEALATIRFTSTLVGSLIAITLAWQGYGPISLAWGSLATASVNAGLATLYRPRFFPWMPGRKGLKQVVSFGSSITGASLFNTSTMAMPELFLGKLQGMAETGMYSRGQGLAAMFQRLVMDAVYSFAMPYFAKHHREGKPLSDPLIQMVSLITVLGWSFLGCIAILAYPIIRLLYGPQWEDAVNVTRILCFALMLQLPAAAFSQPAIVIGAMRLVLGLAVMNFLLQAIAAAIGAATGLTALAWGLSIVSAAMTVLWLHYTKPILLFEWRTLLRALRKSAFVATSTMISPLIIMVIFGFRPEHYVLTLTAAIPGAAVGFILSAKSTSHPVWNEVERIIDRAKSLISSRHAR